MNKPCDFCGTTGENAWQYVLGPNRPVVGLGNDDGDAYLFDDDGVWLACPTCSALVDNEDITSLLDRVAEGMGAVLPMKDSGFRETWTALMVAQYAAVMQSTTVKIPA